MDAMAALLSGPRARGAFLLRSTLTPPWSIRVRDEAPLTLVALVRGQAWVIRQPAQPWTVASLASATGFSRAHLARRFTELVGEPPMAFLTQWRLALAADLLLEPHATIGSVARQVGYGSPFALSTAFKRVRGVTPHQHRHATTRRPARDEAG